MRRVVLAVARVIALAGAVALLSHCILDKQPGGVGAVVNALEVSK